MPRIDRYQDPKLYEQLAGEYVLGTLQGRARQRFAQLVAQRSYLRNAVNQWEQRLDSLNTQITAQPPPQRVWRNISRELDIISNQAGRIGQIGFWNNILLWRASSIYCSRLPGGVAGIFDAPTNSSSWLTLLSGGA